MPAYRAICSVPTDAHTETNLLFVSARDEEVAATKFVDVNGFIFSVAADDKVPVGHIAMNSIQRKCASVTTTAGDSIDCAPNSCRPPQSVATMIKVEVEYVVASKKGGELDCAVFTDYFKSKFKGQFFKQGQLLAVVLDPTAKYCARVTEIETLDKQKAAHEHGALVPETTVVVATKEKCQITLVNIPDDQVDQQQNKIVNAFNLEDLGIGGLRAEFGQIFRRAFASRIFPQSLVKKLGINHVKGVLLHGPPGTGKTLIARKIGQILNCREPKIINGPEVFNKYVGGTEENVRKLFADAEAEQASRGEQSQLHLIIFDEFEAICKQRGVMRDNTGVADNTVNQLLSKIDGVNSLNNVLLIGMTNRKDLIDEAILRPGRFEVHVEIGLPDENGRVEIFKIHTRGMRERKIMAEDVHIEELGKRTKNFSGAEIEGVVRSATSHAFSRHIDFENPTQTVDAASVRVEMRDFDNALEEVKPAFGAAKDECDHMMGNGIIDYGPTWRHIDKQCDEFARHLGQGQKINSLSVLIEGSVGCGKSAIAAHLAMSTEFPYVRYISCDNMVSYGEVQKSNIIRKAFEDAYKSKLSVIVLDDLERLIEYSHLGARYSNILLQTLLVLIKRPPPEGKKLLIVGTTSLPDTLADLELASCFPVTMHIPSLDSGNLAAVAKGLEIEFASPADLARCCEALPGLITMKKMILVLEMAAEEVGTTHKKRVITFDTFAAALLTTGLS